MPTPFTVLGLQTIPDETLAQIIETAEAESARLLPLWLSRAPAIETAGTRLPLYQIPRAIPEPLELVRRLTDKVTGGRVQVGIGPVGGFTSGYIFSFPSPIRPIGGEDDFLPIFTQILSGIVNVVAPGVGTGIIAPLLRLAQGEDLAINWEAFGGAVAELLVPGTGLAGQQIAGLALGKDPLEVFLPEVIAVAPGIIEDIFGGIGSFFGIPGGEQFGRTLEGGLELAGQLGFPPPLSFVPGLALGPVAGKLLPPPMNGGTMNSVTAPPPGFFPMPELPLLGPAVTTERFGNGMMRMKPKFTMVRGSVAHMRRTSRRMNPLNPSALRKALRREKAAERMVRRLIRLPRISMRGRACPFPRRRRRPCK